MFTGIIDHCGEISDISHASNSIQLTISHQFPDLVLGESICVDGVCLTVTSFTDHYFSCDISPETLQLSNAKHYHVGSLLNLERSMKLSDRLGGHIVTGHADGVIKMNRFEKHNEFVLCEFSEINSIHALLLVVKGSVCINGVSLTINTVNHDAFSVMLIPHTLQKTNLHAVNPGNYVNVEYDYLAKIVQKNIAHRGLYEPK